MVEEHRFSKGLMSTPVIQLGLGIVGFILIMTFTFRRRNWVFEPLHFKEYKWSFVVFAAVAVVLFVVDKFLDWRDQKLADRMYDFIGDVGELARQGEGVESAIFHTAKARGGGESRLFSRALANAQDEALPTALMRLGMNDGRPLVVQVTGLVSVALAAGGEVGRMLRALSKRLAQVRQAERKFIATVNGKLLMLRFLSNVLFPAMFAAIATMQAYTRGYKWGAIFYLSISLRIMTVDRLRLKSWRRAFAMQPFWLAVTTLSMFFASNAMKDRVVEIKGAKEVLTAPKDVMDMIDKKKKSPFK